MLAAYKVDFVATEHAKQNTENDAWTICFMLTNEHESIKQLFDGSANVFKQNVKE